MPTNTIRLHRVLRTPPERVYRAFLDPDAMAKWLPPHGFIGKVHHLEAKVGGTYKMSFTNFGNGQSHSFGGEYLELVPNERIRHTDNFDDPNLPGEMQVTISLKKVSCGTDLSIVQEGVPEVIPPEACYLGWQESLMLLAQLVEAEIPRSLAMAENKTRMTEASVESYLAAIADETRQADCRTLNKLMTKASKEKPKMWGTSIVGYGSYHYKYESGHEGDSCLLGFSSRKGDISVYLVAGFPGSDALFAKLGRHKRGKACLYLRKLADVDLDVLEQLIAGSLAERQRNHACA